MKANINIKCDVETIQEDLITQMIKDWIAVFPEEIQLISLEIEYKPNEG